MLATLPAQFDPHDANDLARALASVGLRALMTTAKPKRIDPATLPCVVFDRDGKPSILTAIAKRARAFTVLDPAVKALETELSRREFERRFTRQVLLVAPDTDVTRRNAASPAEVSGHWFWAAVRANWSAWVQVLIAAFCINLLSLALPIFVMNVYDRVIPNAALVTLWTLAGGVAIALILDLTLRTLRSGVLEDLGRRVDMQVASRLFDQAMSIRLLDRKGGAAGMANTIRDFESVRDFFGSASFVALIDLLFIGLFVTALFFVVGDLAFVPLLAIPAVLLLALIAQLPIGRSASDAQQLAMRRHIVLVESLLGIEAIKSLNAEPVMQREWERAVTAASRISGKTRFWSGLATNGTLIIQQIVSVCIIVWGVYLVAEGQITIGAMIAANILAGRVLSPLAAVAQTIFRANYARRAMRALNDMMALQRERGAQVKSDLTVDKGAIEFRDVSFRYPGTDLPALDKVSFTIQPQEVVALLGRVGSGKTTAGKLMNGLLQADSGNILVDDHAVTQFDPAELRAGIGYLTQESELFTGTLRENMTIGAPDARDDAIRDALYLAGMDDFISSGPEGLNMSIGEKGNRLSGGQRQGIALARLLLRKPKVLFLDEPTNAMDQQMEANVTKRLKE
ncbi:MAG: ATP-binding cassette domain-containing protein, partial [Arenibacterium sp.]